MLPFGETVMWRDLEGSNWTFASSWRFGIWLGREGKSDMHVTGTRLSTFFAKTIRRLPPPERHETQMLLAMRGTLWSMRTGRSEEEEKEITRKIRTSIRRGHVKRPAKKVVGFMDPPTEGDKEWERKRIKSEREWPTTQSMKAIEHRPQGEWDDQRRWSFPCQRKGHQVTNDAEVQATTISNPADFMSPSGSRRESSETCAMRWHRERSHPGQHAQQISILTSLKRK